MAAKFIGTWKLEKIENCEAYMKEIGVDAEAMKKALAAVGGEKPLLEVKVEGNKWSFKKLNGGTDWNMEFTLGEQFEWSSPSGKKITSTINLVGEKLVGKHGAVQPGGKESQLERWVEGDRMIGTYKCGDVVTRHEFSRQ